MTSLAIEIPIPPPLIRPNGRTRNNKWRNVVKRGYANDCAACIRAALGRRQPPMWDHARISMILFRSGNRRWDTDNLIASMKAACDQLEKCGVIGNDMNLQWGEVEQIQDRNEPHVLIVVEKINSTLARMEAGGMAKRKT